jgi:hypothetical protein
MGDGERGRVNFTKEIIIFGLSLLICNCALPFNLDIDIGDYEAQLAAWNSQNMLDYQINVHYFNNTSGPDDAVINVNNGIAEDPPKWISISTIPEFFSFIKGEEKRIRYNHKNSSNRYTLNVSYNTEYHYPDYISSSYINPLMLPGTVGNGVSESWRITLVIGEN